MKKAPTALNENTQKHLRCFKKGNNNNSTGNPPKKANALFIEFLAIEISIFVLYYQSLLTELLCIHAPSISQFSLGRQLGLRTSRENHDHLDVCGREKCQQHGVFWSTPAAPLVQRTRHGNRPSPRPLSECRFVFMYPCGLAVQSIHCGGPATDGRATSQ